MNRRRPASGPDLPNAVGFALMALAWMVVLIPAAYLIGVL